MPSSFDLPDIYEGCDQVQTEVWGVADPIVWSFHDFHCRDNNHNNRLYLETIF